MDILTNLLQGFANILSLGPLTAILVGAIVGSLVGALPGLGPGPAMAVLLPITFGMDPTSGVLMLAGIYFGAMYGNSTASILLNVPGDAASVVTAIEGHAMTKRGRAGAALALAAIGSFVASTIAVGALMVTAVPMSRLALQFSGPEFLGIALFALIGFAGLAGSTFLKTMMAVAFGLALATIGFHEMTGQPRLTFGQFHLVQGVQLPVVAVGLFGVAEVMLLVERGGQKSNLPAVRLRDLPPTKNELRHSGAPMVRGGVLGFILGVIPGPTAVTATYASYSLEERLSRRRRHQEGRTPFGRGAVEGVAGPEAANNAAAGGAMVPTLLLGIPFTAPTAILMGSLIIHGIIPGPNLITAEADLFWGLIAGLYIAIVVLLILNLPLISVFTAVLRIPRDILVVAIMATAIIGAYTLRNSLLDVFSLLIMGVVGYAMVKLDLPRTATLLAFVIAPILERAVFQTLRLGGGDPRFLFTRPIAVGILIVTALVALAPLFQRLLFRRSPAPAGGAPSDAREGD